MKRNAWGIPMSDEVIERQGCCEREKVDIYELCKNTHPHTPHRWRTGCPTDSVYMQCFGVKGKEQKETVVENGTWENPYTLLREARINWICRRCLHSHNIIARGISLGVRMACLNCTAFNLIS